jgi:hypothetical protein
MDGGDADFAGAKICPGLYIFYLVKPQRIKTDKRYLLREGNEPIRKIFKIF